MNVNNIFRPQESGGGSFLPGDYVQAKADTKTNLLGVVAFTIVMFGVVAAFVVSNKRWESVRAEQERVNAEFEMEQGKIAQLEQLEATRKQMLEKARVATALIETLPRSVLLGELYLRMPEGLSFDELTVESKRIASAAPPPVKGGTRSLNAAAAKKAQDEAPKVQAPKFSYQLSIVGLAKENNMVADYLAALKRCSLLNDVEIEYIRDTVIDENSYRRFRIVCAPNQDADISELTSIQQAIAELEAAENAGGPFAAFGEDGEPVEGGFLGAAWNMFTSGGEDSETNDSSNDAEGEEAVATVPTPDGGEE